MKDTVEMEWAYARDISHLFQRQDAVCAAAQYLYNPFDTRAVSSKRFFVAHHLGSRHHVASYNRLMQHFLKSVDPAPLE